MSRQRLEALAEPGGVMVSGTVYSLAHKQLAIGFEFAGEQAVKNIDEPVAELPRANERPQRATRDRRARRAAPAWRPVRVWNGRRKSPPRPIRTFRGWRRAPTGCSRGSGAQPRGVRRAIAVIAFLFGINLVTDGLSNPWFLYPAVPLAVYVLMRHERAR